MDNSPDEVEGVGYELDSENVNPDIRQELIDISKKTIKESRALLETDPDIIQEHSRVLYGGDDTLKILTRKTEGPRKSMGKVDLIVHFLPNGRARVEMPAVIHKNRKNDRGFPLSFSSNMGQVDVLDISKRIDEGSVFKPEWVMSVNERKGGQWEELQYNDMIDDATGSANNG